MPILLDNTAVIQQGACAPIANPTISITAPNIKMPLASGGFASARFVSAESAAAIGSPDEVLSLSADLFAAPDVRSAVSAINFDEPSVVGSVSSDVFISPTEVIGLSAGLFSSPANKTALSPINFDAPLVINSTSAALFIAPRIASAVSSINFVAPRSLVVVTAGAMAAARVLTPKAYSDLPPFPLSHPRILYENRLIGSTVAAGGTGGANVLNPATYSRWTGTIAPASSAVITFTPVSPLSLDCLAIGAHNLGDLNGGATIRCEYAETVGGAWLDFAPLQTRHGDNNAVMFVRETPVSCAQIRVRVTSGTGPYFVGVIYAGLCLQMQRPIYGGVNPITLNRVTDYFTNQSESGNWLGRQVRRRGLESNLSFERLTAPWYRQYFEPFVKSAITTPFFFAWRPSDYPAEVAYCWTDNDIQPSNSGGGNNYMSVSFGVKAHA